MAVDMKFDGLATFKPTVKLTPVNFNSPYLNDCHVLLLKPVIMRLLCQNFIPVIISYGILY